MKGGTEKSLEFTVNLNKANNEKIPTIRVCTFCIHAYLTAKPIAGKTMASIRSSGRRRIFIPKTSKSA
jgi:hypothetical protein